MRGSRSGFLLGLLAGAAALFAFGKAVAGVATGSIGVNMTVGGTCQVVASNPIAFGAHPDLTSVVTANGAVNVQCTNALPYTVAMDQGAGSGATTGARKMSSGGATVTYGLFRDAARTQKWGNSAGTDTQTGSGDGSVQALTVYGEAPVQGAPTAGDYADTVAVTVSY